MRASILGLIVTLALGAGATLSRSVTIASESKSGQAAQATAQTVADRFIKLDTSGARLVPEGRAEACKLLKASQPCSEDLAVVIISEHYGFSKPIERDTEAEFHFWFEGIGKLDRELRFIPSTTGGEVRTLRQFKVVRSEDRQSPQVGNASNETARLREWRIEGPEPRSTFVTPQAAIAYLKSVKEKTTKSNLKQNIDKSILALERYR